MDKLKEQLRKEAECSLCIETIKNPKILPCHHGFCCECLNKMAAVKSAEGFASFDCPECQAPHELPEGDCFDHFPSSFHHNRLLDLLALDYNRPDKENCSSCEAEIVDYYCQECELCMCPKCAIANHKNHQLLEIQCAAKQHKGCIDEVVERMKLELSILNQAIVTDRQNFKEAEKGILTTRQQVRAKVEELIQAMKEHEIDLMIELDDLFEDQLQEHLARQKNLQMNLAQMSSSVEYAETILQRDNNTEVMKLKQVIVEGCEELLSDTSNTKLNNVLKLDFITNEVLSQTIRETPPGRITAHLAGGASNSFQEAECGDKTATIAHDSQEKTCYSELDQDGVLIQTSVGDEVVDDIKSDSDVYYDVSYKPQWQGQDHMIMTGGEEPLISSSHVISPQYLSLYSFGTKGSHRGQFKEPYGIAVSRTGEIAVTDSENGRLQCFTAEGKFLSEFGSGKLSCPLSVAYTHYDEIIIIDTIRGQGKASFFTGNGTLCEYFSSKNLKDPRSVSVTAHGNVTFCDQGDKTVKTFSSDGKKLLNSFSAPCCTASPCYSACHMGRYYVTYTWLHCIKVFEESGHFLYDIGSKGIGQGKFLYPRGLTVDYFGNLIVCDCANNRLQAFSLEGEFLYELGGKGTSLNHFQHPEDVALDNDGQMYVVERSNYRVQVFQGKPQEFLI